MRDKQFKKRKFEKTKMQIIENNNGNYQKSWKEKLNIGSEEVSTENEIKEKKSDGRKSYETELIMIYSSLIGQSIDKICGAYQLTTSSREMSNLVKLNDSFRYAICVWLWVT